MIVEDGGGGGVDGEHEGGVVVGGGGGGGGRVLYTPPTYPMAASTMGTNKVFILDKYFNELQKFWDTEKRLQGGFFLKKIVS